jgi:hypothetical protein
VGCNEPDHVHTQAIVKQGPYTREMKDIRARTVEESHGDLSMSWC